MGQMSCSTSAARINGDAPDSTSTEMETTTNTSMLIDATTTDILIEVIDELLENKHVNNSGVHSKSLAQALKNPVKKLKENKVFVKCNEPLMKRLYNIITYRFDGSFDIACTQDVKFSIFFVAKLLYQRPNNLNLKKMAKSSKSRSESEES
jgi:hypothetical protein